MELEHSVFSPYEMTFGEALENLKIGNKVRRKDWEGKDTFLFLGFPQHISVKVPENDRGVASQNASQFFGVDYSGEVLCMKTAQDNIIVGWLASQTDMLSKDWILV